MAAASPPAGPLARPPVLWNEPNECGDAFSVDGRFYLERLGTGSAPMWRAWDRRGGLAGFSVTVPLLTREEAVEWCEGRAA